MYECVADGTIIPKKARTVNFKYLTNILRSKDEGVFEREQWMFDGDFRFLYGDPIGNQKVAFCTYPRSGNSFLRRTLE